MSAEQDFEKVIEEFHTSDKDYTFAELICKTLKGKIIEVYIGDTYEDVKYDDSGIKYPAVLVGKVVAAYAECLVLNCAYVDQTGKKLKFGNIVCLNERSIRTLTEVDGIGSLKDTFLSTRDPRLVKQLFDGI